MNRPNELIKEIQDFNEDMYGYELSKTECKELTDYISMLEKALDKICEMLATKEFAVIEIRDLMKESFDKNTAHLIKEMVLKESEKQ